MLANAGMLRRALNRRSVYNVVYQTARAELLDLETLGLLEAKQGSAFAFYPAADLNERIEALKKRKSR